MRRAKPGANWFFVDESGDPTFYDRKGNLIVGHEGCSPILILGFIETQQPESIRQAVLKLQREVIADPYFEGVPSLARTEVAFHAKDDLPEIRYRMFKLLAELDFKAQYKQNHPTVARSVYRTHGMEPAFTSSGVTYRDRV